VNAALGSIWRVAVAEWRQWRRRGDGLPAAATVVVAAGLYAGLLAAVQQTGALGGGLRGLAGLDPGGGPLALRVQRDVMLGLGVLLVMWSAAALAGERERGTFRLLALRVPRAALPLGKAAMLVAAATVVAALSLLVVCAVTPWIQRLAGTGAGAAVRTLASGGEPLRAGALATLLGLPTLVAVAAVALAASALSRTAAAAQAAAAGALVVAAGLGLVPGVGHLSFLTTASWPFAAGADHGAGLSGGGAGALLGRHLLVSGVWAVAGLVVAALACGRRDVA